MYLFMRRKPRPGYLTAEDITVGRAGVARARQVLAETRRPDHDLGRRRRRVSLTHPVPLRNVSSANESEATG